MFKKYFYASVPTALARKLYKAKDKKENNELVNVIKSELINLKEEIEKMFEEETKMKNQMK